MQKLDAFTYMLGLARKAGQVTTGTPQVHRSLGRGDAAIILLDSGVSERTQKDFSDKSLYYDVPCLILEEGILSRTVGKPGCMVAAVRPGPLGERLRVLAKELDIKEPKNDGETGRNPSEVREDRAAEEK